MKKLLIAILITASFNATAGTAFFKYSYVSGMNRVCVYNSLGSDYVITIASYAICPMSINV